MLTALPDLLPGFKGLTVEWEGEGNRKERERKGGKKFRVPLTHF